MPAGGEHLLSSESQGVAVELYGGGGGEAPGMFAG